MLPFNELHNACTDSDAAMEGVKRLLLTWVNSSDGSAMPEADVAFNDMHVFGQGLAYVLSTFDPLQTRGTVDLGPMQSRICMHGESLGTYDWTQCMDVLAFMETIIGSDEDMDVGFVLVLVLQRLGDLLRREHLCADALGSHYERAPDGWHSLTVAARTAAINSVYCLMRIDHLIVTAKEVCMDADVVETYMNELSRYHHEASLHEFYNISIIMDCAVGSILTYKHTFKDLFNDCSQVVYYNSSGNYNRKTQIQLAHIKSTSASDVNVLPLLMQLKPDMPVLFEHTGACTNAACAEAPWTWVVLSSHVFLCDDKCNFYVANSIFELFAFVMQELERPTDAPA
jgi:hypothetical protein